jgi:hypothetical protein
MGDEMKFPNEVWIAKDEVGLYIQRFPEREKCIRYIHESRVPISCGGTMEDDKDKDDVIDLQSDEIYYLKQEVVKRDERILEMVASCAECKEKQATVLTSGRAEGKEIIGLGPNLAKEEV